MNLFKSAYGRYSLSVACDEKNAKFSRAVIRLQVTLRNVQFYYTEK